MRFAAKSNVAYLVVADGHDGARGMINLNWGLGLPPLARSGPTNKLRVELNQRVTLTSDVAAVRAAVPAPVLQWLQNETRLSGATGPTLTLETFAPEMAGTYSVVASNFAGVVTNVIVRLAVPLHVVTNRTLFGVHQLAVRGEPGTPFALQASDDAANWRTLVAGAVSEGDCCFEDDTRRHPGRAYRVVPSPPLTMEMVNNPGDSTLRLRTSTGIAYVLQASADFATWRPLFTNATGDPAIHLLGIEPVPRRFYRLKSWP
jgi:hypothetical protein